MRATAVVLAALALGLAFAPAPSPAEAQTLSAQGVPNIAGREFEGRAAWHGGDDRQWRLLFRADGVLVYSYNGQVYDNGRWVQNDRLVTFHTNTYYALYSGVMDVDGGRILGSMYNRAGDVGAFEFRAADRRR